MSEVTEKYNLVTAATKANVTAGTIRYWILTGRLKAEKEGNFWTIDPDDLSEAILKTRSQEKSDNEQTTDQDALV